MGNNLLDIKMWFRLVYDDKQYYAEYSVQNFEDLLIDEWEKIKGAGDRKEVIKRAYARACKRFKDNAVSIKE